MQARGMAVGAEIGWNAARGRTGETAEHCPRCGESLHSNCYYVGGQGYLVIWECGAARDGEDARCDYRRVI